MGTFARRGALKVFSIYLLVSIALLAAQTLVTWKLRGGYSKGLVAVVVSMLLGFLHYQIHTLGTVFDSIIAAESWQRVVALLFVLATCFVPGYVLMPSTTERKDDTS